MKTFTVFNPATGRPIAEVPDQGRGEAKAAVAAAAEAYKSWSRLSVKERVAIFKRWHALMMKELPRLAHLLHEEQGKPLHEAEEEIYDGALFLEWAAADAQRLHGYTALSPDAGRKMMTFKQPIGVVAAITPWNFPSALPLQKCLPAIACGCTVILKPSEETPLSSLEHLKLAREAGLPEGVFTVLTCKDPEEVGGELLENPLVRKVTFTGSTAVGKKIAESAAASVKKVSLELGGNCPFILFEDGNLDLAVEKGCRLKFYNCGQVCNNVNRFLVHEKLYGDFVEKIWKKMQTLPLGPMNNRQVAQKVAALLDDAKAKGARVLGGERNGLFIKPALVADGTESMALYREEIFGPVAAVYPFSNEEQAVAMANDTEYGLASFVFTENASRQWRLAEALEAGSVGINTTDIYSELLPFGGWKQSGLGREMGLEGSLDPFLETKALIIAI